MATRPCSRTLARGATQTRKIGTGHDRGPVRVAGAGSGRERHTAQCSARGGRAAGAGRGGSPTRSLHLLLAGRVDADRLWRVLREQSLDDDAREDADEPSNALDDRHPLEVPLLEEVEGLLEARVR